MNNVYMETLTQMPLETLHETCLHVTDGTLLIDTFFADGEDILLTKVVKKDGNIIAAWHTAPEKEHHDIITRERLFMADKIGMFLTPSQQDLLTSYLVNPLAF